MIWSFVAQLTTLLLALLTARCRSERAKDLEIALLRQQLRPHQGVDQRCPVPRSPDRGDGPVRCRDVLGGIVHDYSREAA